MDNLKDLKTHFEKLTEQLDVNPGDAIEEHKVKFETQKLINQQFGLIKQVDDLITTQNLRDADIGTGTTSDNYQNSHLFEKMENSDLKNLLNQTSEMNALISAGQFNMHKKDVNDRMSSLAFKMKKVYNLDKKKGPASEVYKYFMSTFDIYEI